MIKHKKPTLQTFEDIMHNTGRYERPGVTVTFSKAGFFVITKDGVTRTHYDIRDAWRAI